MQGRGIFEVRSVKAWNRDGEDLEGCSGDCGWLTEEEGKGWFSQRGGCMRIIYLISGRKRQNSMNHVPPLQGETSRETLALK